MATVGRGVPSAYPVESRDEDRLILPSRPPVKIDVSDMTFRGPMSEFVEQFLTIEGEPFSFKGREYMRPIHDESYPCAKRTILRTGRQVEKCLSPLTSRVFMANGEEKSLLDVSVGDEVLSYDGRLKKTTDRVVAIHDNGTRGVYKATTRLGHSIYSTSKHRLRTLYEFTELASLHAGSMVAGVRRGGEFTGTSKLTVEAAKVIAYIIGDGCLRWPTTNRFSFTNNKQAVLDDFRRCTESIDRKTVWKSYRPDKIDLTGKSDLIKSMFVEMGLWGLGAADKHVPSEIFHLSREDTAAFLNALWATDGHVAKPTPCKYDIEYSSINRALVKQVQNLLYKFGIPSVIREFTPTLYKGTDKRGYSVRVITQEGVRIFLTQISALGKSEGIPLPDKKSNNNRDSIPKEIVSYLKSICPSRRGQNLQPNGKKTSLYQRGLRLSPKYNLTYDKAREYIEFFDEEGIDCQLLKDLVDSDVIWDQIESIEYLGEEHVYDIETEKHHNYVVDGIITHNSSTLAMKLLAHCSIYPWFKTLYVSPSQMQTRQFSADRVRASYERSPRIQKIFTGKTVTDQVFDKRLANGAMMYFRYAFLTPDRCRGLSADLFCYDKDAEVLTDGGWKPVHQLTTDDVIADVNDDGAIEWNKPSYVFSKQYDGEMVSFDHSGMHLRVTSDHNMVVNYKVKTGDRYKQPDKWVFEKAIDLANTNRMGFKMSCAAEWEDNPPEEKIFPDWQIEQGVANHCGHTGRTRKRTFPGITVKYKPFAKLVGYWLAEGHIQWIKPKTGRPTPRAVLSQNKGHVLDDMKACADAAGIGWNSYDANEGRAEVIHLHNSSIGRYFSVLGKSWTKRIPREFFDHPSLLEDLLKGLYAGDGMYHKGEAWDNGTLKTRSRQLANDTQEAWLRLKRPAVIHTQLASTKSSLSKDPENGVMAPIYLVCAYNRDYKIFWKSEFAKKQRISAEVVTGEEVYCFNVKNHRPIIRGRFGSSPVISGNCCDEIQDILTDNIPVIRECLSHSTYKKELYSGTPKTTSNAIEFYWDMSSQNEWLVKCQWCKYWNILGMDNIGTHSIICSKCGKPINPHVGQWVTMYPDAKWEGFRISQLMVPWVTFEDIQDKLNDYPTSKFYNEVLGLPYDSGVKPITESHLRSCCTYGNIMDPPDPVKIRGPVFAGIDWGTGGVSGEEHPSYSILTLGSYFNPNVFTIFYAKKFMGPEADLLKITTIIGQIFQRYNMAFTMSDWGYGQALNMQLRQAWGLERIAECQYVSQNIPIKFEPSNFRYKVDRTTIMTEFFHTIKQQKIQFFDWPDFQMFGVDFLNIDSEFNDRTQKMTYNHMPDKPDDSFHSSLYCWLAAGLFYKKIKPA